jgi:hypothetical protein
MSGDLLGGLVVGGFIGLLFGGYGGTQNGRRLEREERMQQSQEMREWVRERHEEQRRASEGEIPKRPDESEGQGR